MLTFNQFVSTPAPPGFALELLLHLTLVALVVIPIAACCDLLLRRRSAAARHQLWLLAMIAVLAAPVLSLFLPNWSLGPNVAVAAVAAELPVEVGPDVSLLPRQEAVEPGTPAPMQFTAPVVTGMRSVAGPGESTAFTPADVRRLEIIAVTVWIAGLIVVLSLGLIGQFGLFRTRRACRAVRNPKLLRLRDNASAQLGLSRHVLLLENDAPTMPVTWGVWRPVLLLPASAGAWSEERLRMVLLHELMHVRRCDCLWQWLSLAAVACHWFNPLIWFAARRLRTERERACDDGVLATGLVASDYAEQLLDISTGGRRNVFAMCTGIAMARSRRLKGRLRAIVDHGRNRDPLSRRAKAASAVALALVLVPLSVAIRANVEIAGPVQTESGETDDSSVAQQQQRDVQQPAETSASWQHIVTIKAGWNHGNVNKTFPAIVMDWDGTDSWLVSAAWGAEPFPIPKNGNPDIPVESIHLDATGEDVDIVAFDPRLDVGVFTVNRELTPWPRAMVASNLAVGDILFELLPPEQSQEAEVAIEVVATDQIFERAVAGREDEQIEHTILVRPSLFGMPGSPLLKQGRIAAIFLNNGGPSAEEHYALPFEHVRHAYEELRAQAVLNDDIPRMRELQIQRAQSPNQTDDSDAELFALESAIHERLRKVARVSNLVYVREIDDFVLPAIACADIDAGTLLLRGAEHFYDATPLADHDVATATDGFYYFRIDRDVARDDRIQLVISPPPTGQDGRTPDSAFDGIIR